MAVKSENQLCRSLCLHLAVCLLGTLTAGLLSFLYFRHNSTSAFKNTFVSVHMLVCSFALLFAFENLLLNILKINTRAVHLLPFSLSKLLTRVDWSHAENVRQTGGHWFIWWWLIKLVPWEDILQCYIFYNIYNCQTMVMLCTACSLPPIQKDSMANPNGKLGC